MTIGIEAQRLFRPKKHGMDFVALEMIKALQRLDIVNQYFIFVKDDEDNHAIEETSNFKIIPIKGGPYPYWEQVLLPKAAKKYGVEILHCTSNTAPLWLTNIKLVLTLHDIIFLEQPNLLKGSWYQRAGSLYRNLNVPRIVRKASKVITVSNFERDNILRYFSLPKDFVRTVHNGIDGKFTATRDPLILSAIRQKYNLPEKYIFYFANTDPRKNTDGLLRALSLLQKDNKLHYKLVTLGIKETYLQQLLTSIGNPGLAEKVQLLGYVPSADLPVVYTLAQLFVFPSLREGFGLPLLEAMACEVPVVTSNNSSIPEVAADAAHYIDPNSPDSMADGIDQVMNDPALQASLRLKGLARVKNFSWHNNASSVLNIYQHVFNNQN